MQQPERDTAALVPPYVFLVQRQIHLNVSHALHPEIRLNDIYKFRSYLTENTVDLHYKDQLANVVHGNNCRLLWELCENIQNTRFRQNLDLLMLKQMVIIVTTSV